MNLFKMICGCFPGRSDREAPEPGTPSKEASAATDVHPNIPKATKPEETPFRPQPPERAIRQGPH